MNRGLLYACVAYGMWGLLPMYWKALHSVSPAATLAHRMIWSLVVVVLVLVARRQWAWLKQVDRKAVLTFVAVALLLAACRGDEGVRTQIASGSVRAIPAYAALE